MPVDARAMPGAVLVLPVSRRNAADRTALDGRWTNPITAKNKAHRTNCMSNLKQINLGLQMYCGDHDDKTPAGDLTTPITDRDAIKDYLGPGASTSKPRLFSCPADRFHFTENSGAYLPQGRHQQASYGFSSYTFNGLNLLTNFPSSHFGTVLPGIGGAKLGSVREPSKTVLVAESAAFLPYAWHDPKWSSGGAPPMFNDARNMVSFVDGHVSCIRMYWNGTLRYPDASWSVAAYYDPPVGYDYKWSGDGYELTKKDDSLLARKQCWPGKPWS